VFVRRNLTRTLALLIIIVGASWLRFVQLGDWSFWIDEALTVSDSLYVYKWQPAWGVIHGRPLNFWITGWIFSLLPVSEWSARVMPCIVGIITVPLVYFLSRDFLGGRAAMLSSIFLSLSTWHIYWSQNARGYTLLLLFSLISMALFYKGMEKGNRLYVLGSLVALAIGYLAHPVALLVLVAYCVYIAVIPLARFAKPLGYRLNVLSIFVLPVILGMLFMLPGIVKLAGIVLSMSQSGNAMYVLAAIGYYIQPSFIVLAVSGVGVLVLRKSRLGLFLGCVIGVPLVCLLILSAIRGGSALYVFHTLPAYYMAAAVVLTEIIEALDARVKGLGIAMILALLTLQAGMVFEYFTHQHGDRPRWKEATEYVSSIARPGDLVASTAAPVVEFYLGSTALELRRPERVVWLGRNNIQKIQNIKQPTWILLVGDSIEHLQSYHFKTWLESHCRIHRIFEAWTSAKNRSVLVYRCEP